MASLGIPITGDPLYPNVIDVARDDFSTPMRLLAHRVEFADPLTGCLRRFRSGRTIDE
jgi:tRNA pseudouridine32 synthase/23S rRNA pseudouridine746 synthase